jgi:hypothetical protein
VCKLVEQFTERVDHSTSDKKHDDPEHIIHALLKVGYSLRSFLDCPMMALRKRTIGTAARITPINLYTEILSIIAAGKNV